MPFFTILLMILLSVSVIQLIAPGLGSELLPGGTLWGGSAHWFSSDFMPGGWTKSEGWLYLLTELIRCWCSSGSACCSGGAARRPGSPTPRPPPRNPLGRNPSRRNEPAT
ncbi:MAG: hypothetical protein WDM88_13370 [Galbitalea sp.]